MFSTAANPYDEIITKATDENLASEDWALNLEVCDKVTSEGQAGARNAVLALQKRLIHRNPNVQLYALELANTLAQNCTKPLFEELSSRNWTASLDRLVNDRATAAPVKKKALGYIKAWAKQFEDLRDPNLGIMGELYDQLRAKNVTFEEVEAAPETQDETRRRQEEEELARVLELSKQDKGGRNTYQSYKPAAPVAQGSGSSSSSRQQQTQQQSFTSSRANQPLPPAPVAEPEVIPDLNSATRVRALYDFVSQEVGELNFARGDVIKVLDRGFKEWWRGACNGKIGIFPVTYVEAIPELTTRELQEEAQMEAKVFASLGLVDQLLAALKVIDPARGDRLEDKPEVEDIYQASVGLQSQINALIKKYSDQKGAAHSAPRPPGQADGRLAELEHMSANFVRATRQYEELRNAHSAPVVQPQYGYQPAPQDPYAGQYNQTQTQAYPQHPVPQSHPSYQQVPPNQNQPEPQYEQYPPQQQHHQQQTQQPSYSAHQSAPAYASQPPPQAFPNPHPVASPAHDAHPDPGGYYASAPQSALQFNLHRVPTGAPGFPPQSPPRQNTQPGAAGLGAGSDPAAAANQAAWDAYHRDMAAYEASMRESQGQGQGQGQQAYGASPYPAPGQGEGRPQTFAGQGSGSSADGLVNGVSRMTVHGP